MNLLGSPRTAAGDQGSKIKRRTPSPSLKGSSSSLIEKRVGGERFDIFLASPRRMRNDLEKMESIVLTMKDMKKDIDDELQRARSTVSHLASQLNRSSVDEVQCSAGCPDEEEPDLRTEVSRTLESWLAILRATPAHLAAAITNTRGLLRSTWHNACAIGILLGLICLFLAADPLEFSAPIPPPCGRYCLHPGGPAAPRLPYWVRLISTATSTVQNTMTDARTFATHVWHTLLHTLFYIEYHTAPAEPPQFPYSIFS